MAASMTSHLFFFLVLAALSFASAHSGAIECHDIALPTFIGLQVLSATAMEVHNHSVLPASIYLPASAPASISFCNLTVAISHGTDTVWEYIWLPLEGWNGRFVVGGGGGLAAGDLTELAPFVAQGYAAGTSDGGLTLNNTIDPQTGLWILNKPGQWNIDLVLNFAYRAIHDIATIGKAAVNAYYNISPQYSYYVGCSTGGRQGYSSAHFFPDDFDGLVANAPVIYTTRYSVADVWPTVVMDNIASPPNCVFNYYQQQIIAECDHLDGLSDGIITNPLECHFDAKSLIGSVFTCDDTGTNVSITAEFAEVVSKILEGPRSQTGEWQWYGVPAGASFNALANTTTVNGATKPAPFGAAAAYVDYFTFQDPNYPFFNMTFSDFDIAYNESVTKLSTLFPFDKPDMHAFQKLGKKMITWHGQADQYVNPQGTIKFRKALEATHGGEEAVNNFQRVFLAPGAQHCTSSVGPAPVSNVLSVLAGWVENGTAPETIYASMEASNGTTISRDLCLWPKLPYYNGNGDPNTASSFHCA